MPEKTNKMKPRSASQIRKATREFTDRDEPRAAFWKEYAALKEEMSSECYIHVLHYYGIGGIGKTSLLKKLAAEMEEKMANPIYAYINLESASESRVVLERLKNKLQEKAKFSFPLLDLGLYVYAKKIGESANSPEIKQLTEKSPVLGLLLSVVDTIPVVSIASKLLSIADKSVAYIRNYLHMHSRELSKIEYMEPEELYKYLPMLFSIDMANNTKSAKEPVVVFFDTYESLVNELNQLGEALKNDEWIRGDNGIVLNIPGVLWVIAGREKLRWARFNPDWEETISAHILGNLSMADSLMFLEKAGVGGAELRRKLFELTNGTPVYLDLCVDQFMQISESGETPDISMFGKNTFDLIERFMRYMDDSHKDYVYLLACLRNWNDSLFFEVAEAALSNFSITSYEKTKNLSFVISADDGEYSIHKTVREVLIAGCPSVIKQRTGDALIDKFQSIAADAYIYSEETAKALWYLGLGAVLKYEDREAFCDFYIRELRDYLITLICSHKLNSAVPALELLEEKARGCNDDLLAAEAFLAGATFCSNTGRAGEALEKCRLANDILSRLFPSDKRKLIAAQLSLTDALMAAGDINGAFEKSREIYEEYRENFGEHSLAAIISTVNLAIALQELGKLDEALELRQRALSSCKKLYGEIDETTVTAMRGLASTIQEMAHVSNDMEKMREALQIQRQALEISRSLYEENHPNFINAEIGICASLIDLGQTQEALEMLESMLKKCNDSFSEGHNIGLIVKENLAACLGKMGMHEEAYKLRTEVLETRKKFYGENHPEVIDVTVNLANSAYRLENFDKACRLYQEALDKALVKYGENHHKVSLIRRNLAVAQGKMELKEAKEKSVFESIDFENLPCD